MTDQKVSPLIARCHQAVIACGHEFEINPSECGDTLCRTPASTLISCLKQAPQYAASKRAISFSERATRRRELLVVKTGTAEIRLGNRLLDTLGERGIFGEMALIDHNPRSATAVALTDTTLVPLGDKGFSLLVAYAPNFALSVLRVLARHLRAMTTTMIH